MFGGYLGTSLGVLGGVLGQPWGHLGAILLQKRAQAGFWSTFDLFATRGVIIGPISHNFFGCVLCKFGDHFGSRSAQERVNMGPRGPRGSKS